MKSTIELLDGVDCSAGVPPPLTASVVVVVVVAETEVLLPAPDDCDTRGRWSTYARMNRRCCSGVG
jgi:hypothetical protein